MTQDTHIHIGILSLLWDTGVGGGVFAMRVLRRLLSQGVAASAFTAQKANASSPQVFGSNAIPSLRQMDLDAIGRWFGEYLGSAQFEAWLEDARRWIESQGVTHLIVNAPLASTSRTQQWIRDLRQRGLLWGRIIHEAAADRLVPLTRRFIACGDWSAAAAEVKARETLVLQSGVIPPDDPMHRLAAEFRNEPDFLLFASDWTAGLHDHVAPNALRCVLHPLLVWPDLDPSQAPHSPLTPVEVGGISPVAFKGLREIADVIANGDPDWRFRILSGGYGNGTAKLKGAVEDILELWPERVEWIEGHLPSLTPFYQSLGLFLFPSRQEGYGMVAAEALQAGTPVVCTDYPAILEAVGDGARCIPWSAGPEVWREAVREVLSERDRWVERARARADVLRQREEEELSRFVEYLTAGRRA